MSNNYLVGTSTKNKQLIIIKKNLNVGKPLQTLLINVVKCLICFEILSEYYFLYFLM